MIAIFSALRALVELDTTGKKTMKLRRTKSLDWLL